MLLERVGILYSTLRFNKREVLGQLRESIKTEGGQMNEYIERIWIWVEY
jgi:hypothetical protein